MVKTPSGRGPDRTQASLVALVTIENSSTVGASCSGTVQLGAASDQGHDRDRDSAIPPSETPAGPELIAAGRTLPDPGRG